MQSHFPDQLFTPKTIHNENPPNLCSTKVEFQTRHHIRSYHVTASAWPNSGHRPHPSSSPKLIPYCSLLADALYYSIYTSTPFLSIFTLPRLRPSAVTRDLIIMVRCKCSKDIVSWISCRIRISGLLVMLTHIVGLGV